MPSDNIATEIHIFFKKPLQYRTKGGIIITLSIKETVGSGKCHSLRFVSREKEGTSLPEKHKKPLASKQIVSRVEELVQPLCEEAGVSLWDVTFDKEGGQYYLTVTIDHPDGIGIDQCEQVSRALDPLLDESEFDAMPSYTLCVSSAGLSRRLKKPAHFAAFLGHTVEVNLYKPIQGSKHVEGILIAYDNGYVTIETDGKQTIYEPTDVAAVRLAVTL